jgi:ribonuclease HI
MYNVQMNMIIFTDGSSRGNPGNGGYAGIILAQGDVVSTNVIELGGRDEHTTNNRMEMTGALMSLRYLNKNLNKLFSAKKGSVKVTLYTDSAYLLNGATKWSFGWKKNNWISSQKEEVLNRDIWEALLAEIDALEKNKSFEVVLKWKLVKGHSGLSLNERCDVIATSFADGVSVDLYKGGFDKYEYAKSIADVEKEIEEARPSKSSKTNSKAVNVDKLQKKVDRYP